MPVLTTRHLSSKVRGKVYMACVHLIMLHGSETWGTNTLDLKRLCRSGRAWSAGTVAPKSEMKHPQPHYLKKLGIKDITAVLRGGRLWWYGHVQRATSCIKSVTNLPLPGPRGKEELERHGLNVSKLISRNVACKTETHGELVFDIAWCCQPHWMGHGKYPNLKMDMMVMNHTYPHDINNQLHKEVLKLS